MKTATTLVMLLCLLPLSMMAQQDTTDAVYLERVHEYVLNTDGSTTFTYSHKLKLLTPYAFSRAYGESFITYNPDWQKLEILRSETTMRDGQKVESPFNAFNEVLPRPAANAAPFSHLKEMVVTHTGVETGAVVNFSYRIDTKAGFMPGLMGKVVWGDRMHTKHQLLRIKVPVGTDLTVTWVRDRLDRGDVEEVDGMNVYTWQWANIPQVEFERTQPPLKMMAPVLYFSTSKFGDLAGHAVPASLDLTLPEAAQQAVKTAMDTHEAPSERALALRSWVADRIAGVHLPLEFVGYRARSPRQTMKYNVGTDLDRAVLLAEMCKAAGIKAQPVLFGMDTSFDDMHIEQKHTGGSRRDLILADANLELGSFALFTDAYVVCPDIDEYPQLVLTLDGKQPGRYPSTFPGSFYLPLDAPAERAILYNAPPRYITATVTSDWSLDQDLMVTGRSHVGIDGLESHAFAKDAFQKLAAAALAAAGQGMKVEDKDVDARASGETIVEAKITSSAALEEQGDLYTFKLPAPPLGITARHFSFGDIKRTTPVELPYPMREEWRFVLHLKGGLRAVDVPAKVEFENNAGRILSVITADQHDVEVRRTLQLDTRTVSPKDYADLQALLNTWQLPAHNTLILSK